MASVKQYSDQTDRELRAVLERARQDPSFKIGGVAEPSDSDTRRIRWGRTTTDSSFTDGGTYPTAPATRFVVEFGDYTFTDTAVGNETATFTAYPQAHNRVAYSLAGWLPEDSIVRVSLHHGKWFIITEPTAAAPPKWQTYSYQFPTSVAADTNTFMKGWTTATPSLGTYEPAEWDFDASVSPTTRMYNLIPGWYRFDVTLYTLIYSGTLDLLANVVLADDIDSPPISWKTLGGSSGSTDNWQHWWHWTEIKEVAEGQAIVFIIRPGNVAPPSAGGTPPSIVCNITIGDRIVY